MMTPTGSLPKLYPSWKKIDYYSFGSNSSYNALLAEFTRRLESGCTSLKRAP